MKKLAEISLTHLESTGFSKSRLKLCAFASASVLAIIAPLDAPVSTLVPFGKETA
jgi:hypothetical protein